MLDQPSTLITHPPAMGIGPEYHMATSEQDWADMNAQPNPAFSADAALPRDPIFSSGTTGLLGMPSSNRFLSTHRNSSLYSSSSSLSDPPLSALVPSSHSTSSLAFSSLPAGYPSSGPLSVYQDQPLGLIRSRSNTNHSGPASSLVSPRSTSSQTSSYTQSAFRDPYFNSSFVCRTTASPRSPVDQIPRMAYDQTRTSGLSTAGMPPQPTSQPYAPLMPSYPAAATSDQRGAMPAENATPPLHEHTHLHDIFGENNQPIRPHIEADISKGFFFSSDQCWTCYRRNYFSVQCSYTLDPPTSGRLYLKYNGKTEQIQALGMCLSAVTDGTNNKTIELVQHTPKRDKGPQNAVQIERLVPATPLAGRSHQSLSGHPFAISPSYYGQHNSQSAIAAPPILPFQTDSTTPLPASSLYGSSSALPISGAQGAQAAPLRDNCSFDRIQFKSATANNGKRRAQQQYYHLIVELHADIRAPTDTQPKWVKVAQRASDALVVRGRSPSHYQNEGPQNQSRRGAVETFGDGAVDISSRSGLGSRSFGGGFMALSPASPMPGPYRTGQYPISYPNNGTDSLSAVSTDSPVDESEVLGVHAGPLSGNGADSKFGTRTADARSYYYPPAFDGSNSVATAGPMGMKSGDSTLMKYDCRPSAPPSGSQGFGQPSHSWAMNSGPAGRPTDTRGYYAEDNTAYQ